MFVEHGTKKGAWKCVGRTDHLVVLSHGKKLNAAPMEAEIGRCPGVNGCVIGGLGRARPVLLME